MGRTRLWAVALAAGAAVAATAAGGVAMGGGKDDAGDRRDWSDSRDRDDAKGERFDVRAKLDGYQEDPLTISTPGNGRFDAHVDERKKEIEFRLSYQDLEGKINAAHIHFGGRHQSGGIIAFLCGTPSKDGKGGAPKGTKECKASPAKVEGTIKPADVIGPQEQGIKPGEFDELVDAIKAGVTYVNVHTDKYPNGEIRGQIKKEDRKKDDRKKDDEKPDWSSKDDEKPDWDWSSKDDEKSDWSGKDDEKSDRDGEHGKDDKDEHSDEKDWGSEHREA
ncbi:CHRD domain-containing protein [Micromonospora sp. NPDC047707]|uniref:CHRD domain-containing protein n=1 Tax=Micromonospora sp. NPDC047707 TaxID=3154498 RepID=UPI0034525C9B